MRDSAPRRRELNTYDGPIPCATVPAMRRAQGARQIVAAL
jgi:hypothetical protein